MIEGSLLYYPAAFMLGALHSFEPAHGKAVLAAYLVGNRRNFFDALLFGFVIAIAHTFSIILLGAGAWVAAEHYQFALTGPVIALTGGVLVLGVGFWMLFRWRVGACTHPGHGHHDHAHPEADATNNGKSVSTSSRGQLILVGIGGGLVPCPSGLAMLMTAVSAGNLAQGLGLAVAFSMGAGAVVVVLNMLLYHTTVLTARQVSKTSPITKHIPLISSFVVIVLGMWLSANAFLDVIGGAY